MRSALPPGLLIARSMAMSRAGSGRSGYWKAPLSTLALSASAGKTLSPYSPLTRPLTAMVPEVLTLSKSWAYTAGTSERMLRNFVLGALNATSRPRFLPAVVAEPETPRVRSLRRTPVSLKVYDFRARSACTSAVRASLTRLR